MIGRAQAAEFVKNAGADAGATLFSFVFAFMHFASELALFGTLSWKKALAPMLVAGMPPGAQPLLPCIHMMPKLPLCVSSQTQGQQPSCSVC